MKQTVNLGYGKANLSTVVSSYACFKVTEPFVRVTAAQSGARIGHMQVTKVGVREETGVLINVNVAHDNGTVILLQVKWQRGMQLLREGSIFLRLRHGAPMYQITGTVPTGHENICGDSVILFSGYADLLSPSELTLLGLQVPKKYIDRYMDPEEMRECFSVSQLARETIGRPTLEAIATPEGLQMREVPPAAPRRMIFRQR